MRVNARERLFFSHLVSLVLCLAKSVSTACSRSKWFSDDVDSRSLIVTFKQLCNLLVDIKRTSVREMGLTREMCRPRYRHVNDVKTFTAARKGHVFLRKISPVYIYIPLSFSSPNTCRSLIYCINAAAAYITAILRFCISSCVCTQWRDKIASAKTVNPPFLTLPSLFPFFLPSLCLSSLSFSSHTERAPAERLFKSWHISQSANVSFIKVRRRTIKRKTKRVVHSLCSNKIIHFGYNN